MRLPTSCTSAGYGTRPGRIRCPVTRLLAHDEDMQALCDRIFLLAQIDELMPELRPRLFGRDALESILHNSQLRYSPGEPAINISAATSTRTPTSRA